MSTIRKTLEETSAKTAEFNQEEESSSQPKLPVETKPQLTSTTSVQLVTDSDGDEEEEEEEEDVDKVS